MSSDDEPTESPRFEDYLIKDINFGYSAQEIYPSRNIAIGYSTLRDVYSNGNIAIGYSTQRDEYSTGYHFSGTNMGYYPINIGYKSQMCRADGINEYHPIDIPKIKPQVEKIKPNTSHLKEMFMNLPEDKRECPICDLLIERTSDLHMTPCFHFFHERCVQTWIDTKNATKETPTCPSGCGNHI